ncbi:hypothetical protein XU18_1378 [Perkinsela sp. CCAP 1560/4]|nr:hypothetical protein XU18_1378 [Perkinsela sp. CCAP 1560/4]|eukprot:KNH08048.1 hypothetical protein XU18_1378 [Perkinsela sp. CCAP 1560/4]
MKFFGGFHNWFNIFFTKTNLIPDSAVRDIVSKASATAAWSMILFTALGTAGIDTSPILTGLGVGGASLGFAARDIGANLMAGLMLAFNRHRAFGHGRKLRIGSGPSSIEGVVCSWDLRHLILLNSEMERVYVPNSMVYSSIITVENPADFPKKSYPDINLKVREQPADAATKRS